MKPLVLVLGAAGLAAAGVALLSSKDAQASGLPPPDTCMSAQEVWAATIPILADPSYTSASLRNAAKAIQQHNVPYCDDAAKQAADNAVMALNARADELDKGAPPVTPSGPIKYTPGLLSVPPSPVQIPGGTYYDGHGWCPPGATFDAALGLCSFNSTDYSQPTFNPNFLNAITTGDCEGCGE